MSRCPDVTAALPEPPQCLPPRAPARRPRVALPAGATDCHCHVFEDPSRYPLVPDRSYTPVLSDRRQYGGFAAAMGIERTVQVSASVYGSDNRLTLELIAQWGRHRARGVAGLSLASSDRELEELHAGGMRGVRLSTLVRGYGGSEALSAMAAKVSSLGWHLQLHFRGLAEIAELSHVLMGTAVPLVFDHMGSANGGDTPAHPGFRALLEMLRQRDDVWVKISSWYRRSRSGWPWHDMRPFALALAETRPDRLLFGSNWPHPGLFAPAVVPDDGALIDVFCDWFPEPAVRDRILVANPGQLYGFADAP